MPQNSQIHHQEIADSLHYDVFHTDRRDLTMRHQIKQIAMGWTSVGPLAQEKLNMPKDKRIKSCLSRFDSTALTVACSFCVQSAILSALIWSPYTRGLTTAAAATETRTKTRTQDRQAPVPAATTSGHRDRQWQPWQQLRTTVAKCASWCHVLASHWCRADIEHVDSIQDDAMITKLLEIDLSINHTINHYFIVRPHVDQRAGQLSLPHVRISKTERNRITNIKHKVKIHGCRYTCEVCQRGMLTEITHLALPTAWNARRPSEWISPHE